MDSAFVESIKNRLLYLSEADTAYATASEHRGKARYGQAAKSLEIAADVYQSFVTPAIYTTFDQKEKPRWAERTRIPNPTIT